MTRHPEAIWPDSVERRQLWALDIRLPTDAPLVKIERGERDRYRADCLAGDLICPIPDCADRRLIARGASRRDHFAHRSGGGHGPETIAHWAAKHLVGIWLRQQPSVRDVHVDDASVETGQRPDVSGLLDDGRLIAFEIQYALMSPEQWQSRHDRYAAAGIIDVWLWGRHRRWISDPDAELRHRMSRTLVELRARGLAIRWIEPDVASIIAPRLDGTDHLDRTFPIWKDHLFEAVLEDGQFVIPSDRQEAALRREREEADARERVAAAERRAALEARISADREQARADAERRAESRRAELAQAAQRRRGIADDIDDMWRQWQAENADWLRPIWQTITTQTYEDRTIDFVPAFWHGLLFASFIKGRVGNAVDLDDVSGWLARLAGIGIAVADELVASYAVVLVSHGYLGTTVSTTTDRVFVVLADQAGDAVPRRLDVAPPPERRDPARASGQLSLFEP